MKKLIAVLLISFTANGQVTSDNKISKEIDNQISQANAVLTQKFQNAVSIANKAKIESEKNNYTKGVIESNCIIAIIEANTNKSKEALSKLKTLLPLARKINDKQCEGKIFSALAQCFYTSATYDSSVYYHQLSITCFENTSSPALLANANNLLAASLIKKGNMSEASIANNKAFTIQTQIADKTILAQCNNLLGEIFNQQRLFQKAIKPYTESYSNYFQLNNKSGIASSTLHLGNVYYLLVKDDSATKYYTIALNNFTELGDSNGIAICYSNLSRIFLEAGEHSKAIEYANSAISTAHTGNYNLIEIATLQHLGDIYADMGDYPKAIDYINQALQLNHKYKQLLRAIDCYKSLSEIYDAMNNHKSAYHNLLLAYHIKDTLQPIEFNKQLAEMQTKYETEKKEKQIVKLNEQKKEQQLLIQKRNFTIISIVFLVFIISIVSLLFIRQNNLKQKQANEKRILEKENEERTRIAKDIHDEIGSGLSKISLTTELSKKQFSDNKPILHTIETIGITAHQLIENMRDLVWALKPENSTLDQLVAHLREYVGDYLENFPVQLKINFQENIPSQIKISKEVQHHILLTFKEAINNAVKHSQATEITVSLNYQRNLLKIKITDNGKGFDISSISKKGNGLSNMHQRIVSVGGAFSIESSVGNGTTISFECTTG